MALAVMCAGLRRGLPQETYEGRAAGRILVPAADASLRVRDVPLDERPPLIDLAGGVATAPLDTPLRESRPGA